MRSVNYQQSTTSYLSTKTKKFALGAVLCSSVCLIGHQANAAMTIWCFNDAEGHAFVSASVGDMPNSHFHAGYSDCNSSSDVDYSFSGGGATATLHSFVSNSWIQSGNTYVLNSVGGSFTSASGGLYDFGRYGVGEESVTASAHGVAYNTMYWDSNTPFAFELTGQVEGSLLKNSLKIYGHGSPVYVGPDLTGQYEWDSSGSSFHLTGVIYGGSTLGLSTSDSVAPYPSSTSENSSFSYTLTLTPLDPVPLPASNWLLFSALLGGFGFVKRGRSKQQGLRLCSRS